MSTRILKFETSITNQEQKATLGEHIVREGGISQRVQELAEEFAKNTVSVQNAMNAANAAKGKADSAVKQAESALRRIKMPKQRQTLQRNLLILPFSLQKKKHRRRRKRQKPP